jgi:hypothetical protein
MEIFCKNATSAQREACCVCMPPLWTTVTHVWIGQNAALIALMGLNTRNAGTIIAIAMDVSEMELIFCENYYEICENGSPAANALFGIPCTDLLHAIKCRRELLSRLASLSVYCEHCEANHCVDCSDDPI